MTAVAARAIAVALILGVPAAALAHHGWGWTEDEESRLSGTIKSISFTNPHMHLQLQAANGLWEVDLSPPIVAQGSGFGPSAAKAGDQATLTGHRARDRNLRSFKGETITVRGKTYDVYPQREKSLKPG